MELVFFKGGSNGDDGCELHEQIPCVVHVPRGRHLYQRHKGVQFILYLDEACWGPFFDGYDGTSLFGQQFPGKKEIPLKK